MLKQSLIFLILSIIVVVFARYAHIIVVYIDMIFIFINYHISPIFSQTGWGPTIRKILVLMLIPLLITAIPALIYKFIKGRTMPHFLAMLWIIWTIVVLSTTLIR